MRGAVLGDETAVAMAGCNTSSHCRGWLEGSKHRGTHCIGYISVYFSAYLGRQFHVLDSTVVMLFNYLFF